MRINSRFILSCLVGALLLTAGTISNSQIPVPPAGIISTVAGNGTSGFSGDGGLAVNAQVNSAMNVAVDAAGNLYIADSANNRIRKVNAATGVITTVAGNGSEGLFKTGGSWGDGGPAINATVNAPSGVAVDAAGNLYISDPQNNIVREVVASTGIISTLVGTAGTTLSGPIGIAVDEAGNLYIANAKSNQVEKYTASTKTLTTIAGLASGAYGYSGDGGPATSAALNVPVGVAVNSLGDVFILDMNNYVVRKVTGSTGVISTYAGNGTACRDALQCGAGGPATSAELGWSQSIAIDNLGNVYVPEYSLGQVAMVNASTGIISSVAGAATNPVAGDGILAVDALLDQPWAAAVDANGNLYIDEIGNNDVRVVGAHAASATSIYVAVQSSDPKPTMGESVTLTATVTNGLGSAVTSGSVTWFNGNTNLGQSAVNASGVATIITTLGPGGNQQFSANYTGAGSGAGKLTLQVMGFNMASSATFAISLPPHTPSAQVPLTISAFHGFTGTADLSCSGMPAPGSCSLSPTSINFTSGMTSATVHLTVNTSTTTTAQANSAFPAGLAFATLCPLFLLGASKRFRRSLLVPVLMICGAVAGMGMVGCGSKTPTPTTTTTPTTSFVPAGTYTVTVVATSGINTVKVPVTIIMQ